MSKTMRYCKGVHCPIKKSCKRYWVLNDPGPSRDEELMISCTNQKKFLKANE